MSKPQVPGIPKNPESGTTKPAADSPEAAEWSRLHEEACAAGKEFYRDPQTGLWVGTRVRLLARGFCCHSGCRHCPYSGK